MGLKVSTLNCIRPRSVPEEGAAASSGSDLDPEPCAPNLDASASAASRAASEPAAAVASIVTPVPEPEPADSPRVPHSGPGPRAAPAQPRSTARRAQDENVNLQNLGISLAGLGLEGSSSSSSSSSFPSASSAERPGAFGTWAIKVCVEGEGTFCSASQLARRHCRPGASDRARVGSLLAEHSKQKYSASSRLLADSAPLLEGSSPSTAADLLLLLRLVGALDYLVNGKVHKSHIQMVAVLLAVGKHVRMLQSASRIVGRDLVTELRSALPDTLLLAARTKLAARLRSEAGVASLVKMIKLVPTVVSSNDTGPSSSSSGSARPAGSHKGHSSSSSRSLTKRHTDPGLLNSSQWGSLMASQGEMHGLLDTKAHDILDSAFSLSSPRPPLSPSSARYTPRSQGLTSSYSFGSASGTDYSAPHGHGRSSSLPSFMVEEPRDL